MKRPLIAALFALALMTLTTIATPRTAQAQCGVINVTNLTNCDITLCVYDQFLVRTCLTLTPAGTVNSTGQFLNITPIGVISAAKNHYLFAGGNPGCTPCIRIPGSIVTLGCCAVVCYDAMACTMTVTPCTPPDPCLP